MKINIQLKKLSFVFLLFVVNLSIAQDAFQRLMTTNDRNLTHMGSLATDDGGFYMLNVAIDDNDPTTVNRFQISRNNPKGNLIWTEEYTIKDITLITNLKSIDISLIDNDTLMINGITQDLGIVNPTDFICKLNPQNGEIVWSGSTSDEGQGLPLTIPIVLNGYDGSATAYNTHTNALGDQLVVQRVQYDSNNQVESKQAYFTEDSNIAALLDAVETVDSNNVLTFQSDLFGLETATMTLDSNGVILGANQYSISPDSLQQYIIQTTAISMTPDTGVVLSGVIINQEGPMPILTTFVIKVDSIGQIEWSKVFDTNSASLISQSNDVLCKQNGEIILSGKYLNISDFSQGDYMVTFDKSGNVIRQLDFGSDNSFFILIAGQQAIQFGNGELNDYEDGGTLYTTTGFDPLEGRFSPYIIKTDPIGNAICNDTLAGDFVSDYAFLRDTLIMSQNDVVTVDTFVIDQDMYDNFNVPILQLLDTFFCPQDPIMVTLNAEVQGATSYTWDTGETTPTLDVFEEGEYSVTVTIGEKICYALCDTSRITQGEFPMATINPDFTGLCELGRVNLRAQSSTDIMSLMWNTNETSGLISVTEPGMYSVTITDSCENTAEASVSFSDADFELPPPEVNVTSGIDTCEFVLRAEVMVGDNVPTNVVEYEWSTSETSSTIRVSDPGTYTVTVTDFCGTTAEGTVEVERMSDAVLFPDVFFPSGATQLEGNRLFGPFVKCPDFFDGQNFNLQVFNRFGNKVFESDNITSKWNGTYNGEQSPRDVYMYQWSYDVPSGETQFGEGTITLYK